MDTYYVKAFAIDGKTSKELIIDVKDGELPYQVAKSIFDKQAFVFGSLRTAHKVSKAKAEAHVKAGVPDHRLQSVSDIAKGISKLIGF